MAKNKKQIKKNSTPRETKFSLDIYFKMINGLIIIDFYLICIGFSIL